MWMAAGVGLVVVVAVTGGLALLARALPAGRTKELAGFLPNSIVLLRRLRRDAGLPWRARLALAGALAYLASPIQLIPNFIPIIGQSDDVAVITLALRYACRRLPREQVVAMWPGDPAYLERILGPDRSGTAAPAPSGSASGQRS
jgi:uncharacterized membrane protein YkvA (DUF1232 family)